MHKAAALLFVLATLAGVSVSSASARSDRPCTALANAVANGANVPSAAFAHACPLPPPPPGE